MTAEAQAGYRAILRRRFPHKLVEGVLATQRDARRHMATGALRRATAACAAFCQGSMRLAQDLGDGPRLQVPPVLTLVHELSSRWTTPSLVTGLDRLRLDSDLVLAAMDWVVAELVEACRAVEVGTVVPQAEPTGRRMVADAEIDALRRVINPRLGTSEYCLALLSRRGGAGATIDELAMWVRPTMLSPLRTAMRSLVRKRLVVLANDERYVITPEGLSEVDARRLCAPWQERSAQAPDYPITRLPA